MRLPERTYTLPGGFECHPSDIDEGTWQDHVVRHPLGVHSKRIGTGPAPWNLERWEATEPPVITTKRRRELVRQIAELRSDGHGCLVPQLTNRPEPVRAPEVAYCKRCHTAVRDACVRLCHKVDDVGVRYGQIIDELLRAVEDGVGELVTQYELKMRLMATTSSDQLDCVVVASWGSRPHAGSPLLRLSRGDQTRVEFYVEARKRLRWRTTYRDVASEGTFVRVPKVRRFLTDFPAATSALGALSDRCIVPRLWWRESHAH
jgi:hypothetical protein